MCVCVYVCTSYKRNIVGLLRETLAFSTKIIIIAVIIIIIIIFRQRCGRDTSKPEV